MNNETTKTIEAIKELPEYAEIYFDKETLKPVEVDCGHYHTGFDSTELKTLVTEFESEVDRLRTALQTLVSEVRRTDKETVGIFQCAAIHGVLFFGKGHYVAMQSAEAALNPNAITDSVSTPDIAREALSK